MSASPTPHAKAFGDELRKLRRQARLSQEKLGEKIGLSGSGVSDIERGLRPVPAEDLVTSYIETCLPGWEADGPKAEQRRTLLDMRRTLETFHDSFPAMPPPIRQGAATQLLKPPIPDGRGLPGFRPPFVGRERELAELAKRVKAHQEAPGALAIHVVHGMAGVGKSEFVRYAVHQYKSQYPDAGYFIDLMGYTPGIKPKSAQDALGELLRLSGVPGTEIPKELDKRRDLWVKLTLSTKAVVLLENASDADQVRPLLPVSPGCLVLVTSREMLSNLTGATPLPLDVLAANDAVKLFTHLAGPCPDRGPAAAEVVELVGHLPLAIVVLAGTLRGDHTTTVADLAAGLTSAKGRLDQASGPNEGVRDAFKTSITRLTSHEQRAFAFLGLYPGPVIGVPQFSALAGPTVSDPRETLRSLAKRNLIRPYPNGVGHPRYEMHDLLRDFAGEQAELMMLSGERPAALERLSALYSVTLGAIRATQRTDKSKAVALDGIRLDNADEASAWVYAERGNVSALAAAATGRWAADVCISYGQVWEGYLDRLFAVQLYQSAERIFGAMGDQDHADIATEYAKRAWHAFVDHPRFWPWHLLTPGQAEHPR